MMGVMGVEKKQQINDGWARGTANWFRAFLKRWEAAYDIHYYRYHAWDQAGYRMMVWIVGGAILAPILLVGAGAGWVGYRHHEEQTHLAKARQFLAQADYRDASVNASRALVYNPSSLAACRVLAEVASESGSPTELSWRRRIVSLSPSVENQLGLATAGLRWETAPFPTATQILGALSATCAANAEYQEVSATLAVAMNEPADAAVDFAAAARLDPGNRNYALNLAVFQLGQTNEAGKKAACAAIEKLGAEETLRPAALRVLTGEKLAEGDWQTASRYSTQLLGTPQASLADRLQDLEICRQVNSSEMTNRLHTIEQQVANNPQVVAEVSTWMRAHGLLAENIQWLKRFPDNLRARQAIQVALAQGYLQSGDWHALLDFSSHGDWDDLDFLRLAMVSHAWSQLGMATLAESNWGEAVRKAGDRFESLTNLLTLAQEWQLKPEEEDLHSRLLQQYPQ